MVSQCGGKSTSYATSRHFLLTIMCYSKKNSINRGLRGQTRINIFICFHHRRQTLFSWKYSICKYINIFSFMMQSQNVYILVCLYGWERNHRKEKKAVFEWDAFVLSCKLKTLKAPSESSVTSRRNVATFTGFSLKWRRSICGKCPF